MGAGLFVVATKLDIYHKRSKELTKLLLSGKSFSDDKNKAETLLQDFSLFCYFACWKKILVT